MKAITLFFTLFLFISNPAVAATDQAIQFPSVQLLTETSAEVNFYSDLVEGRLVAIHFIFTSCGMVCPMLGANFAAAQRQLTAQGISDAQFISVSIDPARDTPAKLAAWRNKLGGKAENWTLVTGNKAQIDKLTKALEVFTADQEDHSGFVLIGNDGSGEWRRVNGLSGGQVISQTLLKLR